MKDARRARNGNQGEADTGTEVTGWRWGWGWGSGWGGDRGGRIVVPGDGLI